MCHFCQEDEPSKHVRQDFVANAVGKFAVSVVPKSTQRFTQNA